MFVAAQVRVLEIVQLIVVATENVRRGNVSAMRDLRAQTAVSGIKDGVGCGRVVNGLYYRCENILSNILL